MYFVDSHCHLDRLDLEAYGGDFSMVMKNAAAANVSHMLCIGVEPGTLPRILEIAEDWPQVFASVGEHPLFVSEQEDCRAWLMKHAQHPKVVGIGETGLDYFKAKEDKKREQQKRFITHIEVAKETGLPLIIHTRAAKEDTLQLLREHGEGKVKGVLHCFTEDLDMAEQAIDMGFYISLSGILTFASADELRDTAASLPLSKLLIETDAPWLAPVPHRGKQNEPSLVPKVAECLAEVKGVPLAEVAKVTADNFFELFDKAK
ncbi:MAG TPA: TatD family hydrolase [Alcanivoracaceae bacterium]|nr:TatD family hydrolase [Alcanivoracaceae bacterium]